MPAGNVYLPCDEDLHCLASHLYLLDALLICKIQLLQFQDKHGHILNVIVSRVGQGPTALAVGAGGVVWTFFSLVYHFSFLSPSLWETARYRLKYCLEGPLSPKHKRPSYFYSFTVKG